MFVILRQILGLELVNCAPAFVLWQAGVGQNRNIFGAVDSKIADGIVHLHRSGSAVQADHIHLERLECGQRGADFGAEQHRARGFKCYLNRDRQALPCFLHRVEYAYQRGFCLQQVLASLDQQNIDAALD